MKHTYTDAQIQAAIDAACKEIAKTHPAMGGSITLMSDHNELIRLHLLKSALDKLPEPTPPTADGKTPGQVLHEASRAYDEKENDAAGWKSWDQIDCQKLYEAGASAVLAAFGGASLEQAIARMESVPLEELSRIWRVNSQTHHEDLKAVRARLIAAAREGQPASQPAEIPWTPHEGGPCPLKDEEVEEWELKYRLGSTAAFKFPPTMAFGWNHHNHQDDIIAYRVTKWREGFGPTAVDWKAKYEEAQKEIELLKKTPLQQLVQQREREVSHWCDMHTVAAARAEKAKADLKNALEIITAMHSVKLSTLRPISEAGEVPAGAVRIAGFHDADGKWFLGTGSLQGDTHFADILPPESKAPAVEAAKPAETFEAHGKTWTRHTPGDPMPCDGERMVEVMLDFQMTDNDPIHPEKPGAHWIWDRQGSTSIIGWRYADEPTPAEPVKPWTPAVGDVVTLKSGGPKMTVVSIKDSEGHVVWFQAGTPRECDFHVATLQPA